MLSLIKELWGFLRVRKKYWLLPAFVALGLLYLFILFSTTSPVAPFIYTLF